jgi:hypothetical protein
MPDSIVQASPGGISPGLGHLVQSITCNYIEDHSKEGREYREKAEDQLQEMKDTKEDNKHLAKDRKTAQEDGPLHLHLHLPHHQDQLEGGGDKAVTPACVYRMPDSRVHASPGGISPGLGHLVPVVTTVTVEDQSQENQELPRVPKEKPGDQHQEAGETRDNQDQHGGVGNDHQQQQDLLQL